MQSLIGLFAGNILLILLFLSIQPANAQSKRGNIGVFGFQRPIALDFNSQPVAVNLLPTFPTQYLFTDEGSASISDTDGNLLFYTNGTEVFNADFIGMPNGDNLQVNFGVGNTTTQIVIVPIPKDPFRYYIVGAQYQGGKLFYALIDMRLDHGRGAVVKKNIVLDQTSTEKVCVIKHSSGEALWLVTHEFGSNKFKTFYVDEDSIHTNPIISEVGLVHSTAIRYISGYPVWGANALGYLSASHDGNQIACAVEGTMNTLELFQFNKATGEVYNPLELYNAPWEGSYGVEFSPDNNKLYLSCSNGSLYQFNLQAGTRDDIVNSAFLLTSGTSGGALQLGPDGQIYRVGKINHDSLDVIENPNALGVQSSLVKNKLSLKGQTVWMGLPEFIYQTVEPEILYENYCQGNSTKLSLIKIKDYTDISWDFGDAASGLENSSTNRTPTHVYQKPGTYKVKIKVTFADQSVFNYTQPVNILPVPGAYLGKDTIKCAGKPITLTPKISPGYFSYEWSNGSVDNSISVTQSGTYWVKVLNDACMSVDTIKIDNLNPPSFSLRDTTLCSYQTLHIQLNNQYSYNWSDGATSNDRFINTKGLYTVTGQNRCGSLSQSTDVKFIPKLILSLGKDTILCLSQTLKLSAANPVANYLWQDGTTTPIFVVSEKGEYSVEAFNRCESVTDTIKVKYVNDTPYFIPNVITPDGDEFNQYFVVDKNLKDPSINIYNRWGDLVYSSGHYKNSWDGDNLDTGVYYYHIKDGCANTSIKGFVQLIK